MAESSFFTNHVKRSSKRGIIATAGLMKGTIYKNYVKEEINLKNYNRRHAWIDKLDHVILSCTALHKNDFFWRIVGIEWNG